MIRIQTRREYAEILLIHKTAAKTIAQNSKMIRNRWRPNLRSEIMATQSYYIRRTQSSLVLFRGVGGTVVVPLSTGSVVDWITRYEKENKYIQMEAMVGETAVAVPGAHRWANWVRVANVQIFLESIKNFSCRGSEIERNSYFGNGCDITSNCWLLK